MSDTKQTTPARKVFWRQRRFWTVAAALSVLGAVAVVVPAAMAHRGFGGHGGHGGHGFAHDPEKAREHAAFAVEWAFRAVGATEQQRDEGRVVVERVVDQLIPLGESHRAHRQAIAQELVKPHIDRAALEQLRGEGIVLADEASQIAVSGVADLAEVLEPEQRAELLRLLHRFHGGEPPAGD